MTKKKSAATPTTPSETATRDYQIPEDSSIRSIRYLTCQGGGIKGVGDVGAIEELERCGVLAQIEEVAGSSAGGLIATMLAIGCTPHEVREFMLELDFKAFQDKKEAGWSTQLQEVSEGVRGLVGSVAKKPDEKNSGPKPGFLAKLEKFGDVGKLAFGKDLGIWEGDALRYCLAEMIARKTGNPNITFRELAALAGMEGTLYKKLTLTGTNLTDKCGEYYNAETTPDMPIVLAARISASFPGGFKPVVVEEGGLKKIKVDGGLLENLPDVFNKPPYIKGKDLTKTRGNPQVFALTFDDPADRKPSKIKRGFHLAKAAFDTKMSEEEQIRKYGDHIARIDTCGVDTLDFSLPMSRKLELVAAGALAVRRSIETILAKEEEAGIERYKNFSIEELIRIETDMRFSIMALRDKGKEAPDTLINKFNKIEIEIRSRNLSPSELEARVKIAEKRYLKKMAIMRSSAELTDDDLSNICDRKYQEHLICDEELQEKIRTLEHLKKSLEFQREIIVDAFQTEGENKFAEFIADLKELEDNLGFYRIEAGIDGGGDDSENTRMYKKLLEEKEAKYQEIINFYDDLEEKDVLLRFFKDMQKDSNHPEFKMPYTKDEIYKYCSIDIDTQAAYLEECVRLSTENQKLSRLYEEHKQGFLKKSDRSVRYTALMQLKKELDHSIHRNTTVLTKINNYLVKKAPYFKYPISQFMKAVTVLAYITWVPLAAPVGLIALACRKASTDPETRRFADKILHYFNMSDITKDTKRRLFRDHTVALIKELDKAYNNIDPNADMNCIILQAKKMKILKLEFKDIFIRKPGEKQKDYRERVAKFNQAFVKLCQVEGISSRDALATEVLDTFRESVVSDLHHAQSIKPYPERDTHQMAVMERIASPTRQRTDSKGPIKKSISFMKRSRSSTTIVPEAGKDQPSATKTLYGKLNRKYLRPPKPTRK